METSAADLEGRTFVPWWALPLAIPLILAASLLLFAGVGFAMAMCGLVVGAFMSEIADARLGAVSLALLSMGGGFVAFACAAACARGADQLLNPARWRTRYWGAGRCPRCRYNIRGLPTQRCPECGETW